MGSHRACYQDYTHKKALGKFTAISFPTENDEDRASARGKGSKGMNNQIYSYLRSSQLHFGTERRMHNIFECCMLCRLWTPTVNCINFDFEANFDNKKPDHVSRKLKDSSKWVKIFCQNILIFGII